MKIVLVQLEGLRVASLLVGTEIDQHQAVARPLRPDIGLAAAARVRPILPVVERRADPGRTESHADVQDKGAGTE